jgi:hypothetical protein
VTRYDNLKNVAVVSIIPAVHAQTEDDEAREEGGDNSHWNRQKGIAY